MIELCSAVRNLSWEEARRVQSTAISFFRSNVRPIAAMERMPEGFNRRERRACVRMLDTLFAAAASRRRPPYSNHHP
jgi:hypothetical protein